MKNHSKQAIGIFDSGVGGLTVAHALSKEMSNEHIIYFGDTAHMPYGDKSTAAIQAYAVKIAHMLLRQECKLILIACNTASAAAFELVKEYVGHKALVMNVIDPLIHHLHATYRHKTIGLIGTRQTISSHIYHKKMDALGANIHIAAFATNLLAQAIEEFGSHPIIDHLLDVYLTAPELHAIDALVLACTHYPIIKSRIDAFYAHKIPIIDASDIVAAAVKAKLMEHDLMHASNEPATKTFYVSDYTENFARNASLFFGETITLAHYPLWD